MNNDNRIEKTIFYYANQVYEYSFVRMIYCKIGGTFIVRKLNRKYRLKWHLRASQRTKVNSPFFEELPTIVVKDVNKEHLNWPGILISNSNTVIKREKSACKVIFMGHGTGDKKYGGNAKDLESFDYHFITGPKHMQKLHDLDVNIPEEKLIKIGNPRFDEIVNGDIDAEGYLDYLQVQDNTRKTILYAPTWKWGSGTLHKLGRHFCRELTKEYNLIIRPHYFDRKYIPQFKMWAKINGIQHVYFSNPANILSNDTMYDFVVSDLLISDTSSITYEYLIMKKPIIIIENEFSDLHVMPSELNVKTIAGRYDHAHSNNILQVVQTTLDSHNQKVFSSMLENCFYFNDGHSIDRIIDFLESRFS